MNYANATPIPLALTDAPDASTVAANTNSFKPADTLTDLPTDLARTMAGL